METSLKPGFAQFFSCCPKNPSCPKFGGAAAPLAPPARTPVPRRRLSDYSPIFNVYLTFYEVHFDHAKNIKPKTCSKR